MESRGPRSIEGQIVNFNEPTITTHKKFRPRRKYDTFAQRTAEIESAADLMRIRELEREFKSFRPNLRYKE